MNKEKVLAILIGLTVLILANAPIIYFYANPKDGLHFLGRRVINSQDTYTYVSLIEQSKQGKNLLENLYVTGTQNPSLIRPSYWLLGKIAAATNISSVAAYQLGRILFSIVLIILIYQFLKRFFDSSEKRLLAFIIILTSSGLGFILHLIIPNSTDTWISEANTFLTLSDSPHFVLSQSLMLGGFMAFIRFLENKKYKFLAASTILFLLLAFEHPYDLFIVGPIIFIASIFSMKFNQTGFIKSIIYAGISSIGLIYQGFQTIKNPVLKNWQVPSISPTPINYISGFGLLIPLALIGIEKFFEDRKLDQKFILIWAFVTAVLLYSPLDFQRRLGEGIHIPLSILAATGLFILSNKFKSWSKIILYGGIFILSLTSFYMIINDFVVINQDSNASYYYYISNNEYDGMNWLKNNAKDSDGILSNWFYGNIIPGITGRRVYLGHKAQSGNFDQKVALINQFLVDQNSVSSYSFVQKNNIKYIFLGNNDTMIQYGFNPDQRSYLKKVFSEGGSSIYEVEANPTFFLLQNGNSNVQLSPSK